MGETNATVAPSGVGWLTWRLRKELGPHARDDAATRALYSSDASNYRVVPGLVVAPGSEDELAAVVGLAVEAGVPVTMRGAGTSIAGNAIGSWRGRRDASPGADPGHRSGAHGRRPSSRAWCWVT